MTTSSGDKTLFASCEICICVLENPPDHKFLKRRRMMDAARCTAANVWQKQMNNFHSIYVIERVWDDVKDATHLFFNTSKEIRQIVTYTIPAYFQLLKMILIEVVSDDDNVSVKE